MNPLKPILALLCLLPLALVQRAEANEANARNIFQLVPTTSWIFDCEGDMEGAGLDTGGYHSHSGAWFVTRYELAFITTAALRDLERKLSRPELPDLNHVSLARLAQDFKLMAREFRAELELLGLGHAELRVRTQDLSRRAAERRLLPGPLSPPPLVRFPALAETLRIRLELDSTL